MSSPSRGARPPVLRPRSPASPARASPPPAPKLSVKRNNVMDAYAAEIEALHAEAEAK